MILSLTAATAVTIGKILMILAPVAGTTVNYAIKKSKAKKEKEK